MSEAQIAKKVINECLRIKEDEQLLINTWQHTLNLTNALALEAYKVGAVPTVALFTDNLFLDYLSHVPEEYYTKNPRALLSMLDETDAIVNVGGPEDPAILRKNPGEKMARASEADRAVAERIRERKVRNIFLPIGMLTPQRAQAYGFNLDHWRRVTNSSLDVDHEKMSILGKKLASKLEGGSKIQVTAPNGSSLSFSIANRPVHVRDGIIDDEDIAKGTTSEYLPSGTVLVAPEETSAQGTVRFDKPTAFMGKMVKGLQLKFEEGRLTDIKAEANLDSFTGFYNGASGEKDRIASFAIGLNPRTEYIGYLTDGLAQGAVTIGVGANKEIGGSNDTTFGYAQTLTQATVEVDGKQIVTNGKLNI